MHLIRILCAQLVQSIFTALIVGIYDFNGKLPSPTFTAHPKVDGRTGTMYAYGYEAKGDASTGDWFFSFHFNFRYMLLRV